MYKLEFNQMLNKKIYILSVPKLEFVKTTTSMYAIANRFLYSDLKKFTIDKELNIVNSYSDDPYYLPGENDKTYNLFIRTLLPTLGSASRSTEIKISYDEEKNQGTFIVYPSAELTYTWDYNENKIVSLVDNAKYNVYYFNDTSFYEFSNWFNAEINGTGSSGYGQGMNKLFLEGKRYIDDIYKNLFLTWYGEDFSYDAVDFSGSDNSFYLNRDDAERTVEFQGVNITPKNVFGAGLVHVVNASYPDGSTSIPQQDITFTHEIRGFEHDDFVFTGDNRVTAATPKLYCSHLEGYKFSPGGWSNKYFSFIYEIIISHN